jgi:DNA-binding IclR family transcriptional regulator
MHHKAIPPPEGSAIEPEDMQRVVLALVLAEQPSQLAASEIAQEIGERPSVDQAVDDLVRAGLLRRAGDSVLPTRATLYFDRLAA